MQKDRLPLLVGGGEELIAQRGKALCMHACGQLWHPLLLPVPDTLLSTAIEMTVSQKDP